MSRAGLPDVPKESEFRSRMQLKNTVYQAFWFCPRMSGIRSTGKLAHRRGTG
ncbi:hypothetical protein SKPI104516_02325 [Skermania piniformis]